MKEFIGLVTYPLRFSTSFLRTSAGLFTHSSILRTGICSNPLVSSLKGALIFGAFGLSPFACFVAFLAFGDLATRIFSCVAAFNTCGDPTTPIDRPLRVVRRPPLLWSEDVGVGGEVTWKP
jgi:hypothetical protein